MKQIIFCSLIFGSIVITSCGQSAEEKAKMEQAKEDSLKAVDDMRQAADAAAMEAAKINDSISVMSADTTAK